MARKQKWEDLEAWLWDTSRQAAESGIARMMRDPYTAIYLYAKPGSVTTRRDDNPPEGYALATGERLPRHLDVTALTRWIYDVLRVTPCLPIA